MNHESILLNTNKQYHLIINPIIILTDISTTIDVLS